jgi:hypothetical protein
MPSDAAVTVLAALGAAVAASWIVKRRAARQPAPRDFSGSKGGAVSNAMASDEYRKAVAAVAAGHPADCQCQICALARVPGPQGTGRPVTRSASPQKQR